MTSSESPPSPRQWVEDPETVVFTTRDLAFEIAVSSAILRSLDIGQIQHVVLSGVTSGEGLGFNRGVLLLVDDGNRFLRTSMALGSVDERDAHRVWEAMEAEELDLAALLSRYDRIKNDPQAHRLTHRLHDLMLPLAELQDAAAQAVAPSSQGMAPIVPMMAACLRERRLIRSTTVQLSHRAADGQETCFRNWWMVPLYTPERIVGLLVVDDAFSSRRAGSRERHLLLALGNLTAIAVEQGRIFDRMRELAEADGLTGLANRRTYDEQVARMLTIARQTGRPLSLVVFDVDHFKQYNDLRGHLAGDDALRFVARVLRSHARKSDVIARYGGEEFAMLLPDSGAEQAFCVAQKLVDAVRELSCNDTTGPVTLSAGVACSPAGSIDALELFGAADRAVYQAKREGRDRVVRAG